MNTKRQEKIKEKIAILNAKHRIQRLKANLKLTFKLADEDLEITSNQETQKIRLQLHAILTQADLGKNLEFHDYLKMINFACSFIFSWNNSKLLVGALRDSKYVPLIKCNASIILLNLSDLFSTFDKNMFIVSENMNEIVIIEYDHFGVEDIYTFRATKLSP